MARRMRSRRKTWLLTRVLASRRRSPFRMQCDALAKLPWEPNPVRVLPVRVIERGDESAKGPNMSHSHHDCPPACFQGSTDFYNTPAVDEFTPSYLDAGPLVDNVGRRKDGTYPVWIVDKSFKKSGAEQYVEWFNTIWHTGDPSGWGPEVFTNQAIMIDPTGVSKGARQAASSFILIFKYYPELRGEVVSWAANEREIFLNWRFRILRRGTQTPILVPVVDKFCFVDGYVSFRLASFDLLTLVGYLSQNFGQDQLLDFMDASLRNAEKTGGIQSLPSIVWRIFRGIFLWSSPPPPTGLIAVPGDGVVMLKWAPVPEAISYKVTRPTDLAGPYATVAVVANAEGDEAAPPTVYEDWTVTNKTIYWYLVTPNFKKWKQPTPVKKDADFAPVPRPAQYAEQAK